MFTQTYSLVHVFSSGHAHQLSGRFDFVGPVCMVNELFLHCGVVLEVRWLLHSSHKSFRRRCVGGFSVSFSIHVLRFDSRNVPTVAWNLLSWLRYLLLVNGTEVVGSGSMASIAWDRLFKVWNEHFYGFLNKL